ncbi:hypothetical protein [Cupriavidus sp. AcVe19-6a]|uniref:hypothetical protein n=1 Tax=Cupriavidus sp. AcVe19-6a TaxID=2821358 RepID=UPI001AE6BB02|nr:hypothetical protein [Cupriavidus sp. AcVe19-6a]MBP0634890.1 hypothetical protein [Cupriavidus sp. AcVe19-6a]
MNLTAAERDVLAERRRHLDVEGLSPKRDDAYVRGELAFAAAAYAMPTSCHAETWPYWWPWSPQWWKPQGGYRRNLVKAGALILAEIERLDRAASGEKQAG